jgi:hypothetical protein
MSLMLEAMSLLLTVQVTQATVTGTVRGEATGEPLAGAIVALPDLGRAAGTDAHGRYVLPGVPPGPQHITVSFIGHAQRVLHALVPPSGRLEINLSLRAEPVHLHTIEVRHRVALPGLEDTDSSGSFDKSSSIAAIRNHPLLSEPDALKAMEGGPVVLQQETPSGVHVRGGSSDHTAYLLDGVPVFSPYHAAGLFSALNPDALSRISLSSSVPLAGHSDALSGTISAVSRPPGEHTSTQGGLSTTQARLTIDGQVAGGVGYLLSVRSRAPGLPLGERDPSYLTAESGDVLAKLERSGTRGRIRLLAYQSGNEIESAAQANESSAGTPRNGFEWGSRSFGAEWSDEIRGTGLKLLGWSASSDASSAWRGPADREYLTSDRHDIGLMGTMELRHGGARTTMGLRLERSKTSYLVQGDSGLSPWALRARTPIASAFAQHSRSITSQIDVTLGGSLAVSDVRTRFSPSARVQWRPAAGLTVSGSYARVHQFAQSLRNPESVVGNVFPVDLYIGSGAAEVPVARSDQVIMAAEYEPSGGVRVALEAYTRSTAGLLLVAPLASSPFTTGALTQGSGTSRGLSVEAGVSRARFGVLAGYGVQRVRLEAPKSGYVPAFGTTHLAHGGLIVFPTATTSIRLGTTAAFGRRTTIASGGLEWEACNILDRGCEFAGSPSYSGGPLGTAVLPSYLRVDLGFRKHWHFQVAGRDAMVALFGTITNVLNRKNVLTYIRDASGEQIPIEMLPLAPLVVGLDWRF